jgi:parvulin-like peptidyl-prolyl isomerase
VLIGELRERELDPLLESVAVSEEAVNGYYRSHIEKYSKGRKIRLAMLIKERSERWSEAKRGAVLEGLEGLRMRALEEPVTGKGFGVLAIEGTEFQAARYKGGDVGWFSEGLRSRWPEAVVTLGFALKKAGDVSELVEADGRLFVLKLMDERAAGVTPFEEVREGLRHSLTIQAKKDAEREWWKAARAAANVEIFDDALGRVEVPENVRPKPTQVPPGLP